MSDNNWVTAQQRVSPTSIMRDYTLVNARVDLRDIVAVAVSHFHHDHVGGLRHFAGRVPVFVQRAEFEAAA